MDDVKISPLAKRLAEENSIDWRVIHGTGPEGRVIERDILTYLAKVMSGEAELPRQPDVSEPPPPAGVSDMGMMPALDSMGLSGASATLAREGVDLSSMLSDPVFNTPSVPATPSAPVFNAAMSSAPMVVSEQADTDDLGDLDDAIFDLDLSDFTDEPVTASATNSMAFDMPSPAQAGSFENADATAAQSDFEPELIVTDAAAPVQLPSLETMLPLESSPIVPDSFDLGFNPQVNQPTLDLSLDTHSDLSLDVPSLDAVPSLDSGLVAPVMDFSLTSAVEDAPAFDLTLAPEPDHMPEVVSSMPESQISDLSGPDFAPSQASDAQPFLTEPITPVIEPITLAAEPVASVPIMPAPEVALTAAVAAASLTPAVTEPSQPAASSIAASSSVARDFFKVSVLRRSFQAQALQDAARQLEHTLGHAPVAAFLARASGRAQYSGSLALGKLDGEHLSSAIMPPLEGSFRELTRAVSNAFFGGSSADLTVLDASGLGIDDLVLPAAGALLSLGRTHDGLATLALSGTFNPTTGAAFLERVAGLLENPVGLLV
jgi:hypothetical protein